MVAALLSQKALAGGIDMPNGFKPFDLGAAQSRGIQNAMAQMQTMGMAGKINQQNTMRELSQRASQTGENLPDLAAQAGFPEVANKMRLQKMNQQITAMKVLKSRIPLVRDQESLDSFRNDALANGAKPGDIPEVWNPNTKKFLRNLAGNVKREIIKLSPGGRAFTTTGEEIARVPMTPRQRGKGKAAGTARERLALSRRKYAGNLVANIFGGFYDPVSNKIKGLSKTAHKQMAGIRKRVDYLMEKYPNRKENDIVNQAAREAGVKGIPEVTSPGGASVSGVTGRRVYNPATGGLD